MLDWATLLQNRTEQNRTEQNRTEQNRTEQNRTEQKGKCALLQFYIAIIYPLLRNYVFLDDGLFYLHSYRIYELR